MRLQEVLGSIAPRLLVVAAAATLVAACAGDESTTSTSSGRQAQSWSGPVLVNPLAKPNFTLTTDTGQPYDFRQETQGKVVLLYFGYTNCPDACPAAMANIALALRRLPAGTRSKVVTVFVTTDPSRDTPDKLKAWLAQFDPTFVGLTGSAGAIAAVQNEAQLPIATDEAIPGASPGSYGVDHAAVILAFTPDGYAHVEWPDGVPVTGIAGDLTRLVTQGFSA